MRVDAGPAGFLLFGQAGCDVVAKFSPDGRNWSPAEVPVGCGNMVAAQVQESWIAVARLNENETGRVVVLSSDDALAWTDVTAQSPPPHLPNISVFRGGLQEVVGIASLAFHGQSLVLAGEGVGGIWTSSDQGQTWVDAGVEPDRIEIAVSDLGFVGVSSDQVLSSADGTVWRNYAAPPATAFHDVAAAGDTLVALATDGIYTWTPPGSGLADTGANTASLLIASGALVGARSCSDAAIGLGAAAVQ